MDFARSMLVISGLSLLAFAQGEPAIRGVWRGKSTCVQKESACRDETVVYRFATRLGKPGLLTVSADKIVDGRVLNMGSLEFQYVADEKMFVCKYAQGVWRLSLLGEKIEGTLTRPDGSLFRRLVLQKTQ